MNIAEIMDEYNKKETRKLDVRNMTIERSDRRTAWHDRWLIALVVAVIIGAAALAWYVYRAGLTLEDVGLL